MSASEFVVETQPALEQVHYLEDRLYEFNSNVRGITDAEWLAIFVRDEQDRIIASICGNTWGGRLEIRQFWVEESRRYHGLRTRLLGTPEQKTHWARLQADPAHDVQFPSSGVLRKVRLSDCRSGG